MENGPLGLGIYRFEAQFIFLGFAVKWIGGIHSIILNSLSFFISFRSTFIILSFSSNK